MNRLILIHCYWHKSQRIKEFRNIWHARFEIVTVCYFSLIKQSIHFIGYNKGGWLMLSLFLHFICILAGISRA